MHRDVGLCRQLSALQGAFNSITLIAVAITAVVLVALATSTVSGLPTVILAETHSPRLTVVFKNQIYPSISELEARTSRALRKGEASGYHSRSFDRQGQWI
jgi:hypothetical protein